MIFDGFELRHVPVSDDVTLRVQTGCTVGHDRGSYVAHRTKLDRRAGRTIGCPTLVAWSRDDDMAQLYGDPAAVWRPWASDVRTAVIDSGHHMAEQAPGQLTTAILDLLFD